MAELNAQIAFLEEAKTAAEEFEAEQNRCRELRNRAEKLQSDRNNLLGSIEKEKENAVSSKRKELEKEYDRQTAKLEGEMRKLEDQRQKAREHGVKDRIRRETGETVQHRQQLRREFSGALKSAGIGICANKAYFMLFMPHGFGEILLRILLAILEVIILPCALIVLCKVENPFLSGLFYLAALLLFGGLHLLIANAVGKGRKGVLQKARALLDEIKLAEREIRRTSSAIRKDKDDSHYSLQSYDEGISLKKQTRDTTAAEKTEALTQFDNVTKPELCEEVEAPYRESLAELEQNLAAALAEVQSAQQKLGELDSGLKARFGGVLGESYLNAREISRRIRNLREQAETTGTAEPAETAEAPESAEGNGVEGNGAEGGSGAE